MYIVPTAVNRLDDFPPHQGHVFNHLVPKIPATLLYALGKSLAQYMPHGDAIHLRRVECDAQKLEVGTAVVQVVARRQESVVLVEELVATPSGESGRRIVRCSNVGIQPAVLKEVQVVRRLVRGLALEQRAQAQG